MVVVQYDELNEGNAYNSYRFGVLKALWGAEKDPYLNAQDIAWIGTRLDMTASFDDFQTIAETILGAVDRSTLGDLWTAVNGSYNNDTALGKALDGVLTDHGLSAHFAFASEGQMKTALNGLIAASNAESVLNYNDFNLPVSQERAAVFSLAYEGIDVFPIVQALLGDNDRFQAWYDIRYDSNDDVEQSNAEKRAVAIRRYIQSDYLELYNDPQKVGYQEAFAVARGYQSHRNAILAYEHTYDPDAGNKTGAAGAAAGDGSGSINDALQPAIAAILKNFGIVAGPLEEVLYATSDAPDINGDGTAFDSKKNDDDLLVGNIRDNRINGGGGNDVILGLGGKDDLIGGTGNDKLYGGIGADTLDGGKGNDALSGGDDRDVLTGDAGNDRLEGGGGKDRLAGGSGNDTYLLMSDAQNSGDPDPSLAGGGNADVIVEQKNGGTDTVIIGVAGSFDLKNVETLKLSGTVGGNVAVTLNSFQTFTLTDHADTLTLTINKLQKAAIEITTGAGKDTVRIDLSPGIDPSQVLDHKGLTARFDFTDLTAGDTIDLTSIGIKKIVTGDLDIHDDKGFYLMAPDTQIHVMNGNQETKTYTNDTDSWFVVKCGDDTPYGPEIFGHVEKGNFDI